MKKMKFKIGDRVDLSIGMSVVAVPESEKAIATKAMPRKDLEYGQVDVIVSNSALDRHGEKIMVDGIITNQFERNPVVAWAHDYSGLPIGKSIKLWKQDKQLISRTQFATKEYPFAETVYKLVVGGFINAVSIGGIVREIDQNDETVIKQLEMVEYSFVPVGAHPDALVVGKSFKKQLGITKAQIEREYQDFLSRARTIDKLRALPQNMQTKYIEVLEDLLKMLKSETVQEPIEVVQNSGEGVKRKVVIKL